MIEHILRRLEAEASRGHASMLSAQETVMLLQHLQHLIEAKNDVLRSYYFLRGFCQANRPGASLPD